MNSLLESGTTVQSIQPRSISSTEFVKENSPITLVSYDVNLPNI